MAVRRINKESCRKKLISLTIPGKPLGKQRPRFAKMGKFVKVYTPKETMDREAEIRELFQQKYPEHIPYENAVSCKAVIYLSIPKATSKIKKQQMLNNDLKAIVKPDADNAVKLVMDSINGIAYKDDSQVVILEIEKLYSEEPRIEVIIEEI